MDDGSGAPAEAVTIDLSAVILAVTGDAPRVLRVRPEGAGPEWAGAGGALPRGPLDVRADRTLDRGLRRWVVEQTGLTLGYVEQLYTFGDTGRDPRERAGGPRVLTVAYLALVREQAHTSTGATWCDVYDLLPWEDHRGGRPPLLEQTVAPGLARWGSQAPQAQRLRRERTELAFGLGGLGWDGERVLERYELLYEAGMVAEAARDAPPAGGVVDAGGEDLAGPAPAASSDAAPEADARAVPPTGAAMALDHRRILATALGRVRGKLSYRPVVFELLPDRFTLLQLQRVVEALAGVRLHKQNFRRLVDRAGLVEGTGTYTQAGPGRPAEQFRFRREVLRERPAPGVGLPRRVR